MMIFWKLFMSKNGFLLITHLFKTSWTPSPVATHPNRLCPVVLKGQNMVYFFHFFGRDFFLSGGRKNYIVLGGSGFKTITIRSGVKNPI